MTDTIKMMVPGTASNDDTLDVFAPFDHQLIATVESGDAAAVEQALDNADQLFRDRSRWLKPAQRIAILEKTAVLMGQQAEHLAIEAAREGGKPLIDSRIEVARAIDGIKICIETLRTDTGHEIPMGLNAASEGKIAFTRSEPIGVVVAVSAFNHPLNLIVHQVGPAIASGCPVIVKPAGDTPLSCFRFVQILRDAGLPEDWCQALVIRNRDFATQLVTDQRVGFFSFIGSGAVGWSLRSQLAPGTRCALEHGGVAPVIVTEHANLAEVVPKLVKGGYYHAGQVCVSVQRVYAHESIVDQLARGIAEQAEQLTVGDPTLVETDIGPLIRTAELDRVEAWVNEAIEDGATLLTGGHRISDSLYECTLLLNPSEEARVSREEVFGPVICIYSYRELDEAIARANGLPVSFQASVFTDKLDEALKAYSQLNASAVMVNEQTAFRVDWMPFAGLKQSGLGVGGIPHTFRDMQIEKMLVIHSAEI